MVDLKQNKPAFVFPFLERKQRIRKGKRMEGVGEGEKEEKKGGKRRKKEKGREKNRKGIEGGNKAEITMLACTVPQ